MPESKIAGKRNLPYAVVDIDDTYAADGSVSKSANFNIHFPTLLTVSYTHLDVYKRQAKIRHL